MRPHLTPMPGHPSPPGRRAWARGVTAAGVAAGLLAAGCGSTHATSASTTTVPTGVIPGAGATTSTTTATTVPAAPAGAQTEPDQAASDLIDAWVGQERQSALAVATPGAVATLFATPYAGQRVELRGCNVNPPTPVCSYGPQGGASSSLALYQLEMAETPGGKWYVSSVQIEG